MYVQIFIQIIGFQQSILVAKVKQNFAINK